ncbi:surface antigen Bsp, putative [Trichomonas vaginalis G3]|uniref:Surface antigen Bsp, putative n=1 Tax=Trichomonas vaginalis (strain ATCC PRA-98 / G3) TaxID=412133 RepID=A2EVE3_TRIV3|nr:regulation of response to stimulus [Trichomonas vaginalis G3]EAY03389.1 surface antigen Bsp, putative [Trichomonas vaginalis G3]KAI5538077.1 regulation of response to stimulus [Trichomonas vaginalis G3]|eukprot:XP_001315612.1 surface antigen Bsp [Trichomonas vaginalis G3]
MSKLDDNDYSTDGLTLFSVSKRYTNVIISSKCETIFGESSSDYAFNHVNDILESFSFEDNPNLANINKFSFYNCIQLRSVNLSPCTKLKTIGDSAFQDCSSLETIILPEGLTTIGSFMISQTKISSINIPSTVTTIINFGLGRTPYLRTVTFTKGSQLKSITGNNFFYTNMKTFTVPENVDFFDGMAFSWSYTLETIIVDPDNPYLFSDGKALYNKNLTKI